MQWKHKHSELEQSDNRTISQYGLRIWMCIPFIFNCHVKWYCWCQHLILQHSWNRTFWLPNIKQGSFPAWTNYVFYDWFCPTWQNCTRFILIPVLHLHGLQFPPLWLYYFYWTKPVGLCMTQISLIPPSILKATKFAECDQFIQGVWLTFVI